MVDKYIKKAINVIDFIANILMILLVGTVFFEIVLRAIFNYPIIYTTELTQIFFPWLIFLAAINVTYKKEHINIAIIKRSLSKKLHKFLDLFIKLVMLFFSILMIKASYDLSIQVMNRRMPMLGISRAWFYSSIIVGFIGISIIILVQIFQDIYNLSNNKTSKN